MTVYACGLNSSCQILNDGPNIVCCPTRVTWATEINQVRVAFSHVFWKNKSRWKVTGFKQSNVPDEEAIGAGWKVFVSDNRTAAINCDGSLLIWEKRWRSLHFQDWLEEQIETADQSPVDNIIQQSQVHHIEANRTNDTEKPEVSRKVSGFNKFAEKEKIENNHLQEKQRQNSSMSFSQVALEDNALLALSIDGVVYCGSVPVPLRVKVKEVAVGKEHCMTLTQDGEVYTWGSGMRGQMGIGELCKSEKPLVIENLQGIIISSINCGAWHCLANSDCGDVYVWGWNESGQLGFPPRSHDNHTIFESFQHACQCPGSEGSHPSKCDYQYKPPGSWKNGEDLNITKGISVQQESNKSLSPREIIEDPTMLKDESVWRENDKLRSKRNGEDPNIKKDNENWGGNHNSVDSRVNSGRSREVANVQACPRLLDFWCEDINVVSVECGDRHTLFLLEDGSAWAAGMNRYGQLGLGHTAPTQEPSEVIHGEVVRVAAGGWNSVFFTTTSCKQAGTCA